MGQMMLSKLQMMASMTVTAQAHGELMALTGEAFSNSILRSAHIQVPPSWQPLMAVSYKPSQQWMRLSEQSVLLKF